MPGDALLVFEATGDCDAMPITAHAARAIAFARGNPRQARGFARALGVRLMTDKLDPGRPAALGRRVPLDVAPLPDPVRARLADFPRRRKQSVEMQETEKMRRHNSGHPEFLREIVAMVRSLDRRVARLGSKIASLADLARMPGKAAHGKEAEGSGAEGERSRGRAKSCP